MKTMSRLLLMLCICFSSFALKAAEITPHKYSDAERQNGGPKYEIPSSSQRILDWCFVQAVLSWVWAIEDSCDTSYFEHLTKVFDVMTFND